MTPIVLRGWRVVWAFPPSLHAKAQVLTSKLPSPLDLSKLPPVSSGGPVDTPGPPDAWTSLPTPESSETKQNQVQLFLIF